MTAEESTFRDLPRVDSILAHPHVTSVEKAPRVAARRAVRQAIGEVRAALAKGEQRETSEDAVASRAAEILRTMTTSSLRRTINATGIILHTALGRAALSEAAQEAVADVTAGFCNVQADIQTGRRMQREEHVGWLLQELTGAEAALVVNNNSAATLLVLNSLAAGKDVIVSRGELVEIGGSFRIPEIMELSGCRLVEVGCTNKTHLRDYEAAISENTALILSVHQSNYSIQGFAEQVDVGELVKLAHSRGIPCAHDIGSGALIDLEEYGLPHEDTVPASLAAGADVVFFSGDKLIGGPQCGIILGKADLLQSIRKNPFYRTFRVDKLTLSALEATLRLFLEPDSLPARHRLMRMLTTPLEEIRGRAEELASRLGETCAEWCTVEVRDDESGVGSGSLSGEPLPTVVVALGSDRISPDELTLRLRQSEPPVFARVNEDRVLLDPRTILPGESEIVLAALVGIGESL